MKKIVIAIDGPSASGKGSLAKKIASHFDLAYLNTGAIYRLIALRVINKKLDPNNFEEFLTDITKNIREDDLENDQLFTEKVGAIASIIAKNKNLRNSIFQFQRDFINNGKIHKNGCVLDGRDTTTVICPDADYKFFVTADVEIRAQRRFQQFPNQDYNEILAQLKTRDENDLNRTESPLKIADKAIIIDNGKLTIAEGFAKILEYVKI
jgi:cytidylate kinase